MAVELRLGPPDHSIQDMLIQRRGIFEGTAHDAEYYAVVERMRVYVMCYYVSSCISLAMRKPTHFKYIGNVADSCALLQRLSPTSTNGTLCCFVQLQALAEEVEQLFQYNSGQMPEAVGYMQVQAMMTTLRGKLDQLIEGLPPQAQTNKSELLYAILVLATATLGGVTVGDPGQFRELADIPAYLTNLRDKMMCMGTITDTGEDRRDYYWKMMQFFKHCLNWISHYSGNEAHSIGDCAAPGDANMSFQRILENVPSEEVTQDNSAFNDLDLEWIWTAPDF
ncbi:hypothetical protein BBK36DRAFT_1171509 [Trichoderma citrinoviride]|uniref:Uncharacterized protein n=1 Tax=Trichoderma citrinoviride TaxID=58853 RepID=A0A2T4B1Q6_9HYPO|nr:hypothetical protein BBK36DRAFT_1171509 [Trichoderma citrinoviride]PTB63265.1 hypothetical protein BBK36DRAFT_1171509 [Trichoderma citrinoviride]